MSVKVKGGMWCDRCRRPVAGQKSTHKAFKAMGTIASGGLYPPVPGLYHCPSCGSTVRPAPRQVRQDGGWTPGMALAVIFLILLIGGCAVNARSPQADTGTTPTVQTYP
jgi:hypothetical protein